MPPVLEYTILYYDLHTSITNNTKPIFVWNYNLTEYLKTLQAIIYFNDLKIHLSEGSSATLNYTRNILNKPHVYRVIFIRIH